MTATVQKYANFCLARSRWLLAWHLPICLLLAGFFIFLPQVDLAVASSFYLPTENGQFAFIYGNLPSVLFVLRAVDWLSRIAFVIALLVLGVMLVKRNSKAFLAAVVLVSLLVGPMFGVNGFFKEQWGRARPSQITQFGGQKQFTPAWIKTNQCAHNCSFSSGHAAAGFALCIGYLVSRRKAWWYSGIALGGLIGFTRILKGGHFLSDVIFSYFIVMILAAMATWCLSQITLSWLHRKQSL